MQTGAVRVLVLEGTLIKIITVHSNIHVRGLGKPTHEGESWSIKVNFLPFLVNLRFWFEVVGACNSIITSPRIKG
jgi:hypothetical protein